MKLLTLTAAAVIALAGLATAPALAQPPGNMHHDADRHDNDRHDMNRHDMDRHDNDRDRDHHGDMRHHGWDRGHHYGWDRGHHHGWRHHCHWVYRHHHRMRVC